MALALYMSSQTFSNLKLGELSKKSFKSIHSRHEGTSCEKQPGVCWYHATSFEVFKT